MEVGSEMMKLSLAALRGERNGKTREGEQQGIGDTSSPAFKELQGWLGGRMS